MPTHDACADVVIRFGHEVVVDALDASGPAEHGVEELGGVKAQHRQVAVLGDQAREAADAEGPAEEDLEP